MLHGPSCTASKQHPQLLPRFLLHQQTMSSHECQHTLSTLAVAGLAGHGSRAVDGQALALKTLASINRTIHYSAAIACGTSHPGTPPNMAVPNRTALNPSQQHVPSLISLCDAVCSCDGRYRPHEHQHASSHLAMGTLRAASNRCAALQLQMRGTKGRVTPTSDMPPLYSATPERCRRARCRSVVVFAAAHARSAHTLSNHTQCKYCGASHRPTASSLHGQCHRNGVVNKLLRPPTDMYRAYAARHWQCICLAPTRGRITTREQDPTLQPDAVLMTPCPVHWAGPSATIPEHTLNNITTMPHPAAG